ncbi:MULTISPECIES: hypothetical protein [Colwellia]|uniref:Lipoprotein n=1 Tax=Colwellia marinimaniae TaxID=1513592 RepID=A0ABQ0MYK7_9GAMM|nr:MULTISPECIES: hypothetical protein [Colwellia]GAW96731.1 hypothetical protein MTCD1_02351 [Colwellia marinimaniae]
MRNKILLLTLLCLIQGCTVLGMVIDSQFPSKDNNDKSESFSEMGFKADIELAKSVIYDQPLPGNEPKILTGCKSLKGKKQVECYEVSSQLNKSLQEHARQ